MDLLSNTTDSKIPVKVVSIKDHRGIPHVEILLEVDSYLSNDIDAGTELKRFKAQYELVIEKARNLISGARNHKESAKIYWQLGRLLQEFLNSSGQKFRITNYRRAFEREIGLTDSVIGILLDFAQFFEQEEVDNRIPVSLYYEFVRKARRMKKIGKLGYAKDQLVKMADRKQLPDAKKYRAALRHMIGDHEKQ